MIDFGHAGTAFTWHNKRKVDQAIFARLERQLANRHWMNLYPFATFHYWIGPCSDILNLLQQISHDKHSHFTFEAKWLLHDDFFHLLKMIWSKFFKGYHIY